MQYGHVEAIVLQRIPWTHGDSFGSIARMYVDHVIKKYKDPVIVFDSYPELPSIKTLDNSYLNTSAVFSKRPLAAVVKR
jgi:hypothetical protein